MFAWSMSDNKQCYHAKNNFVNYKINKMKKKMYKNQNVTWNKTDTAFHLSFKFVVIKYNNFQPVQTNYN